jgi:hypothetical protein
MFFEEVFDEMAPWQNDETPTKLHFKTFPFSQLTKNIYIKVRPVK